MNQTRPLVDAYLERLHGLLDGAPRETRAEVMAGVREHLDARLPDDASPAQVRSVLGELGTPEQIADEAYAAVPDRAAAPTSPRLMERAWVPIIVITLSLLWLAAPAVITSTAIFNARSAMHPTEMLVLLVFFPVWPFVALLVGVSRLWVPKEKLRLIAALPALAIWGWLLLLTGLLPVVTTAGGLLGVLTVAWVVVQTGAKGVARAR